MKTMKKGITIIAAFIMIWLCIFTCHAIGENTWDCTNPDCGRKGNTENFCGGCGSPAPWVTENSETETADTDGTTPEAAAENNKFKELYTKEYTISFDTYSAGTPGTRGNQKTINLSSDISTYGNVIGIFISHIDNSNVANYQAFMSGVTLYANAYRAVSEAASSYSIKVKVTFAK